MSRKPRIYSESGIHHIILRGNNKQNLFHEDKDRLFFLQRLKKYSLELNIEIFAYCLMNNHVHILIGNARENMSLLVQKLANSYVSYFNHKYDRCGHLFQGRFKSEPIMDDEYFKTVYRYIIQNSDKAGLESYDKYKWNSFSYVKANKSTNFINTAYILEIFGSKKILIEFLSQKSNEKCMEYENKIFFTDAKAFQLIKKLFRINSPCNLERLPIEKQMQSCKILKKNGLSTSQISRITGISRNIIKSA